MTGTIEELWRRLDVKVRKWLKAYRWIYCRLTRRAVYYDDKVTALECVWWKDYKTPWFWADGNL